MVPKSQFNGLTMPVFSAFGWAGEEAAINFALDQLQLFIDQLFFSLPREVQKQFPVHGVERDGQLAFISINEQPAIDLYIAFFARPVNLETSMILTDKSALVKVYRKMKLQNSDFLHLMQDLGPEWNLRIQQMEYNKETGETTHYKDLYKDLASNFGSEGGAEIIDRAEYLNSEDQWVVPIYLSKRTPSEKIAAMGQAVTNTVADSVMTLMPIVQFLTGQVTKKKAKGKKAKKHKVKIAAQIEDTTIRQPLDAAHLDRFTYVSELKPLHIRRGFINLTPNHWPFFALTARTETRPVTVSFDDRTDDGCAVWRLVPNDQARLVLSTPVHMWLEENFDAEDLIKVSAVRMDPKQIRIALSAA